MSSRPVVVCLVGTDHHPFDRLVSWCDILAAARPDIDVIVQHGRSQPPKVAEGQAFFEREELAALLARADVAISHGGPGLISEIRAVGIHPIGLPRNPDLGEHVDAHQMRFVARMGRADVVEAVSTQSEFMDAITRRLSQLLDEKAEGAPEETVTLARVKSSVSRFGGLVDEVLSKTDRPSARDRVAANWAPPGVGQSS